MLHFFVTRRGEHTLETYLKDWAGDLRHCIKVHLYEDFQWPEPSPDTFIFTDLERLSAGQFELAVDYAGSLKRSGVTLTILNSPERVMRRLDLLNEMSRSGINRFRAFRFREMPEDFRYPGFLRMGRDHDGAASPLLRNRDELLASSKRMLAAGADVEDVLAVEYCETLGADGMYRKYSYFKIADEIIPAHIIFSKGWVAKDGKLNREQLAEEALFYEQSPHAAWARGVFETAGIEYGRIDFSLCADGAPQVWEINTNPMLLGWRAKYLKESPLEMPHKELLSVRFAEVFEKLLPEGSMERARLASQGTSSNSWKTWNCRFPKLRKFRSIWKKPIL